MRQRIYLHLQRCGPGALKLEPSLTSLKETRALPSLPGLKPVSLSLPLYTIPTYNSIDALFSLLIIVLAVHSWPAPTLNIDPKPFDYCGCGSLATCACTKHQQLHFRGHSDFHDSQCMQPILILYYMSVSVTEASRVVGLMVKTNGDA